MLLAQIQLLRLALRAVFLVTFRLTVFALTVFFGLIGLRRGRRFRAGLRTARGAAAQPILSDAVAHTASRPPV
jgi:hypothetical protein